MLPRGVILLICILVSLNCSKVYGQVKGQNDSASVQIPVFETDSTNRENDSIQGSTNDVSALDIGKSRGIFISSEDKLIQLRILGSIRTGINLTDQNLPDPQTFNPYEIPTEIDTRSPNFFAGLQQTRLGIEVTRKTKMKGDLFIRFEGDFKNTSTSLRIRHAYGQIGRILIGQTWSLLNNVSYQPALVSLDGPVSGSGLRTPQVRYSYQINQSTSWNIAMEYSSPNFEVPDSVNVTILPVIPSFTARFSHLTDIISYRFAAIVTTISGRLESNPISYTLGYGGSFAGKMNIMRNGELFLQFSAGKGIAHYMDTFNGKDEDMDYNPNTSNFETLFSSGGYIAYELQLPKELTTSFTMGITSINNKDYQPDDAYNFSFNSLLNLFWQPTEGARLGIEFANGRRYNKVGTWGLANRVSFLFYYDF